MAAFFSGVRNGAVGDSPLAKIKPENGDTEYFAAFLGGKKAEVPNNKTPREVLAKMFVAAGYDWRWLVAGICQSQVYQRECVPHAEDQRQSGLRSLPGRVVHGAWRGRHQGRSGDR